MSQSTAIGKPEGITFRELQDLLEPAIARVSNIGETRVRTSAAELIAKHNTCTGADTMRPRLNATEGRPVPAPPVRIGKARLRRKGSGDPGGLAYKAKALELTYSGANAPTTG